MAKKRDTTRRVSEDPLLERYRAALQRERPAKTDLEAFGNVEIARPAVRPKGVTQQAIRRAVREAIRTYVEKHAGSLERS
jgi:hypothetical protein